MMTAYHELLKQKEEVSTQEMFTILLQKFEEQADEISRLGTMLQNFLDADDNRVFNPDEIADLLKVHKATVRKWIREGHLEYVPDTKYKCTGRHLKTFLQKTHKRGFLGL